MSIPRQLCAGLAAAALALTLSGPAAAETDDTTSITTTTVVQTDTAGEISTVLNLENGLSFYGRVLDVVPWEGSSRMVHLRTFGNDPQTVVVPLSAVSTGAWVMSGDIARVDIPAAPTALLGLTGGRIQVGFTDVYGRTDTMVLPVALLEPDLVSETQVAVLDPNGTTTFVTLDQAVLMESEGTALIQLPDVDIAVEAEAELR